MKQYHLLIVDDEKRFADMLAKRLSLRGCHCDVCYNGQQALDLVRRKNFFLILLDLHLPDIYGIEVLKRIKVISAHDPRDYSDRAWDGKRSTGMYAARRLRFLAQTVGY